MAKFLSRTRLLFVLQGMILCALLLPTLPMLKVGARAQDRQASANTREVVVEQGKFRLHKLQQPIGEESYELRREGDSTLLRSTFEFTDRMTKVALAATLSTRRDLTPERFEIKGKTSRSSEIDASVEIQGRTANVRRGHESAKVSVPDRFFTIDGYAPFSIQMMLVRYWATHDVKGALKT